MNRVKAWLASPISVKWQVRLAFLFMLMSLGYTATFTGLYAFTGGIGYLIPAGLGVYYTRHWAKQWRS